MFFFLVEAEADELNITEKVCEVGRSCQLFLTEETPGSSEFEMNYG